MKSIKDGQCKNKRVLVRVDFNVPIRAAGGAVADFNEPIFKGKIQDDFRIKITIPTINYLKTRASRIILVAHLGRPRGEFKKDLELEPVAKNLAGILGIKEEITKKCIDDFWAYQISPKIFLLENIRFYKEEEENDLSFSKKLASLADIYVDEAFSDSHREHASIEGITHFLPSYAGFNLEKEIKSLIRLRHNPKRPFVFILGGAKVSDKIEFIQKIEHLADWILLGGLLGNTFLVASGKDLKETEVPKESIILAKQILKSLGRKIILPAWPVFGKLNKKAAALDIGKEDVAKFASYIQKAKTIFWNGNLGMTEITRYKNGSKAIALQIIKSKAFSVAAGGDTIGFLRNIKIADRFSFISSGGGASLKFLAGEKFKALERLM